MAVSCWYSPGKEKQRLLYAGASGVFQPLVPHGELHLRTRNTGLFVYGDLLFDGMRISVPGLAYQSEGSTFSSCKPYPKAILSQQNPDRTHA